MKVWGAEAKLHSFLAIVEMEVNGQMNSPPSPPLPFSKAGLVEQKVDLDILEMEETSYPCRELNPVPFRL
jgi:hypothetical protein